MKNKIKHEMFIKLNWNLRNCRHVFDASWVQWLSAAQVGQITQGEHLRLVKPTNKQIDNQQSIIQYNKFNKIISESSILRDLHGTSTKHPTLKRISGGLSVLLKLNHKVNNHLKYYRNPGDSECGHTGHTATRLNQVAFASCKWLPVHKDFRLDHT